MNLDELNLDDNVANSLKTWLSESAGQPPSQRWLELCPKLANCNLNPLGYRAVWEEVFSGWPQAQGPRPMWLPKVDEETNLSAWIDELGLGNYKSFHQWSCDNREDFWNQAIQRLQIPFVKEPQKVLDTSEGVAKSRWLLGAQLNIGQSCFLAGKDEVAIVQGEPDGTRRETSYGELEQLSINIAASLTAAGFQAGDAIAVFMPMTHLSVAIYLGMVRAGVTVVSIADSFAPPEIENRLRIAEAKAVFTYDHQLRAGRKLPLHATVCQATDVPAIVIPCEGPLDAELRGQDHAWDEFLIEADDFPPFVAGPEHIVNILFSSGTTGDPKAIPWTQLTPMKCAVDGYCHHNLKPGDVVCWPTNLGWMMGPWLIFATLMNQGTIALFGDAPMSAEFGKFVQDEKVNMLGVVPTIVKAWRTFRCMEDLDWSAIKVFSSTGESSQADDMFYLSALAQMRPVIEYCGGTEIGGGYVTSTVVQPNAASTFSTPAVGLDLAILDENGEPSESGELFIVPPSIGLSSNLINRDHFETYFADTPSTEKHPVLRRHGDHLSRLPGGYFVAGGRVDDTMNLGGIKTSSAELERVMNQIEGVKETAAVAVNEAGGPNSLVVFAVLESEMEKKSLKIAMNKLIRTQLNPLFKVKSVHVVESMPRTASGKVMRRKLREQVSG